MVAKEIVVAGGEGHIASKPSRTELGANGVVAVLQHTCYIESMIAHRFTILAVSRGKPVIAHALAIDKQLVGTHSRCIELRLADFLALRGGKLRTEHGHGTMRRVGMSDEHLVALVADGDGIATYLDTWQCAEDAVMTLVESHIINCLSAILYLIVSIFHCSAWHSGKAYLCQVGGSVEVMAASPRTDINAGSIAYAHVGAAHCKTTEPTTIRISRLGNQVLAVDGEIYIAGLHIDGEVINARLAGNQLVDIALWELLLIDGEERNISLVAFGITYAVDVDSCSFGTAYTTEIELKAEIVVALQIVGILEGIVQTKIIGTKDDAGLVALNDVQLGSYLKIEMRGSIEGYLLRTNPLRPTPCRLLGIHQTSFKATALLMAVALCVPHFHLPRISSLWLQSHASIGHIH